MTNVQNKSLKLLRDRFKKSLQLVSNGLGIHPQEVTREDYIRFSVDTDIESRLNKEELNSLGGFKSAKASCEIVLSKMELDNLKRKLLLDNYTGYIQEVGITPSLNIIKSWGVTNGDVLRWFGNAKGLYNHVSDNFPEVIEGLVNDSMYTDEYTKSVKSSVSKYKRFVITCAVSGKEVDKKALAAIESYCKHNKAKLLVLPCEDVASRNSIFKYELDRSLRDHSIVFKDLKLNDNIHISSIAVSAKQITPLTGLDRIAQAKGSAILASPKQDLKFVATSNIKLPHALMTTGAITVGDYSTDKAMSQRTSYIAEFDHVMGAIIVEIADDSIYHFRQIQFDSTDSSFYDLGKKYSSSGKITKSVESVCVFGDTHVGSHDPQVDDILQRITKEVSAKEVIVHDMFDNRFNNHHDIGKTITRAKLANKGLTSLIMEGVITRDWLKEWTSRVDKVTIVKSNHDEALDRYLNEARWVNDSENMTHAIDLVKAKLEGKDALEFLITEKIGLPKKNKDKINWLKRDQDYLVYGIENGSHGDKGANGSKGTLKSIENSYYKATVGHSHTAGILRNVYQVGTSTFLKLSYNSGPSSWTNTMCIQYPNGQRQLINIIKDKKGKYSYKL